VKIATKSTSPNRMNQYDKEGQSLRRNVIVCNQANGDFVIFYTQKISDDQNHVIHNAAGQAVKFGKGNQPTNPSFGNQISESMPNQTTMNHRYKIFIVHVSRLGNIPGKVQILNDPRSISDVLRAEILTNAGASEFGIECSTFAWFTSGKFYHLILHEDDPHFNIDLAMIQLANLPGRPPADFFPNIQGRMTRRIPTTHSTLANQGLIPSPTESELPHEGMDGVIFRDPAGSSTPIFAAPALPHLDGGDPQAETDLLDDWFQQIRDILTELKNQLGKIDVTFQGGGTIPIPKWFRDWCAQNGITITVID